MQPLNDFTLTHTVENRKENIIQKFYIYKNDPFP